MAQAKTSISERLNDNTKEGKSTVKPEAMNIGNRIMWKSSASHKGRGVFALVDIKAGEVVECSPVTIVPKVEGDILENIPGGEDSIIDQYLLRWQIEKKGQEYCLGHGFLMLYNHHPDPNGELAYDFDLRTISMVAIRDIAAGEEITFDYDCELWFDMQA